jgi:hypothetical protein
MMGRNAKQMIPVEYAERLVEDALRSPGDNANHPQHGETYFRMIS